SHGLRVAIWAAAIAGITFSIAFHKVTQRMVEEPDISTGRSGRAATFWKRMLNFTFGSSIDRAVIFFCLLTFFRSRKHRLLLAMFIGIGFAIALAYTESLLRGEPSQKWNAANSQLLVSSLVVLFFLVFEMLIVFTFPHALRINLIFRVNAVENTAKYFAANIKTLYGIAAIPMFSVFAVFFLIIWPWNAAVMHLFVLAV